MAIKALLRRIARTEQICALARTGDSLWIAAAAHHVIRRPWPMRRRHYSGPSES
jgi:hypothetical protein